MEDVVARNRKGNATDQGWRKKALGGEGEGEEKTRVGGETKKARPKSSRRLLNLKRKLEEKDNS